jgi:hypothetical protein
MTAPLHDRSTSAGATAALAAALGLAACASTPEPAPLAPRRTDAMLERCESPMVARGADVRSTSDPSAPHVAVPSITRPLSLVSVGLTRESPPVRIGTAPECEPPDRARRVAGSRE